MKHFTYALSPLQNRQDYQKDNESLFFTRKAG
jgi:hypothetical protein